MSDTLAADNPLTVEDVRWITVDGIRETLDKVDPKVRDKVADKLVRHADTTAILDELDDRLNENEVQSWLAENGEGGSDDEDEPEIEEFSAQDVTARFAELLAGGAAEPSDFMERHALDGELSSEGRPSLPGLLDGVRVRAANGELHMSVGELRTILRAFTLIVERRNTIPILAHALVVCAGDVATFTATDLDIELEVYVQVVFDGDKHRLPCHPTALDYNPPDLPALNEGDAP